MPEVLAVDLDFGIPVGIARKIHLMPPDGRSYMIKHTRPYVVEHAVGFRRGCKRTPMRIGREFVVKFAAFRIKREDQVFGLNVACIFEGQRERYLIE